MRTPGALLAPHRRLFVGVGLAATLGLALAPPPFGVQLVALGALVAVLGVPHGALDQAVAGRLWPLHGWRGHLGFALGYMGLAGLTLAAWLLVPGLALIAFIAYSAMHFADDWRSDPGVGRGRYLVAIAVVSGPSILNGPEATQIFAALAPLWAAELVVEVTRITGIAAFATLAVLGARRLLARDALAWEIAVVCLAGLVLPPLVYFVLYFCALHSPRHFLVTVDRLDLSLGQGAWAALPNTVAALGLAAVGAALLVSHGGTTNDTILSTVFIGLAALTVPHMILVDRFHHA